MTSSAHDLSAAFVDALPITGASLSVIAVGRAQSTISATDSLSARLDDIQFALGEGPHWDAQRTGTPILVSDIRSDSCTEWPAFKDAIARLDVRAVFAFPLPLGAITIGVADLYCARPVELSDPQIESARMLCRAAVAPAMKRAIDLANQHETEPNGLAAETRREVHQATGMILVQLEITATDAFLRLKAHAFSSGVSIHQLADDVVRRRIDFRDLPE